MIPVQESTLSYTVTNIVDVALDAMRDRSAMVSAQDVTDLLLDLRSSLRRTVLLEEAAGDLTDNDRLKREGKSDQAAGKVKQKVEDAKDWVDDKIDDIRK